MPLWSIQWLSSNRSFPGNGHEDNHREICILHSLSRNMVQDKRANVRALHGIVAGYLLQGLDDDSRWMSSGRATCANHVVPQPLKLNEWVHSFNQSPATMSHAIFSPHPSSPAAAAVDGGYCSQRLSLSVEFRFLARKRHQSSNVDGLMHYEMTEIDLRAERVPSSELGNDKMHGVYILNRLWKIDPFRLRRKRSIFHFSSLEQTRSPYLFICSRHCRCRLYLPHSYNI